MNKEEIFKLINENPVFHIATMDGDQPRVRAMLLFRADAQGIIFHTGANKDVYAQIKKNPKVELCFQCNGKQIRVSGSLEQLHDDALKDEIINHPSRKFLQPWKDKGIDSILQIFRLNNAIAVVWTMETNFMKKNPIPL